MRWILWILPIFAGGFILSCSEKGKAPSKGGTVTKEFSEKHQPTLTLEEANKKLSEFFLYTGELSLKNGTAVLEIWNPLQAKTVSPSTILEGLYKTVKIYCDTNLKGSKLDLRVYYNLNGKKGLLFEAIGYRPVFCNAVTNGEKQQIPEALKGAVLLNALRNTEIKVGNQKWFNEFCKDSRIKPFCHHLGF